MKPQNKLQKGLGHFTNYPLTKKILLWDTISVSLRNQCLSNLFIPYRLFWQKKLKAERQKQFEKMHFVTYKSSNTDFQLIGTSASISVSSTLSLPALLWTKLLVNQKKRFFLLPLFFFFSSLWITAFQNHRAGVAMQSWMGGYCFK